MTNFNIASFLDRDKHQEIIDKYGIDVNKNGFRYSLITSGKKVELVHLELKIKECWVIVLYLIGSTVDHVRLNVTDSNCMFLLRAECKTNLDGAMKMIMDAIDGE